MGRNEPDFDFFDDARNDQDKPPYLFLDFLSDRGRWTPSGGAATDVASYKLKFETLVRGGTAIDGSKNCEALMRIIPDNAKEKSKWVVHAHEPDHQAPNNSASSRTWIVRIRYIMFGDKKAHWMRNSLEPAKEINGGNVQEPRFWVPERQADKHPTHIELLNAR
jgi:hypothetical protein